MDTKKIDEIAQPKYFIGEKSKEKTGEEAFFKQGEKPQVRLRALNNPDQNTQEFWDTCFGLHLAR